MSETVLAVDKLCKSFGGVQAVVKVTFDLQRGEVLALIGPNGAGKTTCFNLLNGQLKCDSGSVTLKGKNITGKKPRDIWRLGVGRTFQVTATYSSMTVIENVQMALLSHHRKTFSMFGSARRRFVDEATSLLELVDMADQAQRSAGILAYGDLKRLELAIALAHQPSLLLMDEPTAGMAPGERIALMQLTADIARSRDVSILFTEHDMDVVFSHADRIMVLDRGQLIAQGSAEEVRANEQVIEVYLGGGSMFADENQNADHA